MPFLDRALASRGRARRRRRAGIGAGPTRDLPVHDVGAFASSFSMRRDGRAVGRSPTSPAGGTHPWSPPRRVVMFAMADIPGARRVLSEVLRVYAASRPSSTCSRDRLLSRVRAFTTFHRQDSTSTSRRALDRPIDRLRTVLAAATAFTLSSFVVPAPLVEPRAPRVRLFPG